MQQLPSILQPKNYNNTSELCKSFWNHHREQRSILTIIMPFGLTHLLQQENQRDDSSSNQKSRLTNICMKIHSLSYQESKYHQTSSTSSRVLWMSFSSNSFPFSLMVNCFGKFQMHLKPHGINCSDREFVTYGLHS